MHEAKHDRIERKDKTFVHMWNIKLKATNEQDQKYM